MNTLILAALICTLSPEGAKLKSDCEASAISSGYDESIYIPQCQIAAENLSCGYETRVEAWL